MVEKGWNVAEGDPERQKLIKYSLERLVGGTNDVLGEMAKSVLRGEVSLREAATSEVYGAELGKGFGKFWKDYERMSSEERDSMVEVGREHLQRISESD